MCQVCSLHCRYELMGWIVDGESFVPLVIVHPLCPRNSHHNIKPQHDSSVKMNRSPFHFLFWWKKWREYCVTCLKFLKAVWSFSIQGRLPPTPPIFFASLIWHDIISDTSNKGTGWKVLHEVVTTIIHTVDNFGLCPGRSRLSSQVVWC